MDRHSTHPTTPENFRPKTLATPVRLPIEASCPGALYMKGVVFFPFNRAYMFLPARRPSRRACWAVGGYGVFELGSMTAAQSPTAHTPENRGTSRVGSTTTLPFCRSHGISFSIGLGETPAAHTRVSAGTFSPSSQCTAPSLYAMTFVLSLISTWRFLRFSCA